MDNLLFAACEGRKYVEKKKMGQKNNPKITHTHTFLSVFGRTLDFVGAFYIGDGIVTVQSLPSFILSFFLAGSY